MSGTGFSWSALPSRRVVIGSMVGALASGSLLGLVLGILQPGPPERGRLVAAAGNQSPTGAAAPTTGATLAPSPSPAKTKAKPIKTVTAATAAAPDGFIQHPERDRTMFLGTLEALDQGNHDHIVIYVRRADLLTGDRARQFYQNQGQPPRDLAVVPRDNAQTEALVLRPDAAFWGQLVLGNHQNQNLQHFGLDQFLNAANGVLANDEHPPIWVKRTLGAGGDVIYLAEQFVPPQQQQ